jgi:hypothetical protein
MTSNSDDLEEQLRENLKLRRELWAEVDKAAGQRRGKPYRSGWVLFWVAVASLVVGIALVVATMIVR